MGGAASSIVRVPTEVFEIIYSVNFWDGVSKAYFVKTL